MLHLSPSTVWVCGVQREQCVCVWYYIVIPYQLLLLIERLLFASFIFVQALAVVQTDRLLLFVIFIERLFACKFYCIFVLPEAVPRVRAAFAAAFIDGGRIEETPKLVQQGGRVPSRTAPCVSRSHCAAPLYVLAQAPPGTSRGTGRCSRAASWKSSSPGCRKLTSRNQGDSVFPFRVEQLTAPRGQFKNSAPAAAAPWPTRGKKKKGVIRSCSWTRRRCCSRKAA